MPPSALLAMVGPRVANHVLHTLHDAYPERFPLSPTLENFANGEMDIVRTGDAQPTADDNYEAILDALADEARHLLDDGSWRPRRRSTRASSSVRASRSSAAD